ncbi:MurR/RpiR family transcriptional regulator [Salsuginibacillus kocurii]|uniref:MurR/RpiR family transcriptional regulator n=1 Tax=Salsuginibacillus kocurii TaxID=427078 RepID=UPI0003828180|nr:MurR/RpiR family transcriptional regulator [Salsuginibacillus kocurii]
MGSIIEKIQLSYPAFSKMEKRIADYVIHNKETLLNIHIQELADNVGVSVATITRFCKKIECESFVEFKILLRDVVEKASETDDVADSIDSMYQSVIQASRSMINKQDLKTACEWIQEAGTIHIYGLSSSGLTARELKTRLLRMGYTVDAHTDSHTMLINASILKETDLVIAISNSGQTQEVIDAVQLAKRKNARVITFTNYKETKLSDSSDLLLFSSSLKVYEQKGLMNSQLSIVYLLDILSMMLLLDEDASNHHKQTLEALDEHKKI